MSAVEISAKTGEGEAVVVKKNLGDNLSDLIKLCSANGQDGEAVVLSNARANMTIKIQDIVRAGIKVGDDATKIQKTVDAYVPGVKRKGKSKAEKMQDEFGKLDPEEKKALLAKLTKG